jgi:small subunit ribosomal protein S27Ae
MKGREIFKVEGDNITRLRRHCPKCGDGFFLGDHKDRLSCGKCGYTEFKKNSKKPIEVNSNIKPVEDKEKI